MHKFKTCVIKVIKTARGLSRADLYTINKGAILPLLLYRAPVWIEALEKECNKTIYNTIQRLINTKIAKGFWNYILQSPLHLDTFNAHSDKGGGSGQIIQIREEKSSPRDRPRSKAVILPSPSALRITEQQDEHAIQIFTDGSKSEHGVGAGIAIFIQSKLAHQLRYKVHNTCSNK